MFCPRWYPQTSVSFSGPFSAVVWCSNSQMPVAIQPARPELKLLPRSEPQVLALLLYLFIFWVWSPMVLAVVLTEPAHAPNPSRKSLLIAAPLSYGSFFGSGTRFVAAVLA